MSWFVLQLGYWNLLAGLGNHFELRSLTLRVRYSNKSITIFTLDCIFYGLVLGLNIHE